MLRFYENPSKSLGYQGMDKILMISLVSSQKSTTLNILAASVLHIKDKRNLVLLAGFEALSLFS